MILPTGSLPTSGSFLISKVKARWLPRPGANNNREISALRDSPCRACHLIMAPVCTGPRLGGDPASEALSSTYASTHSPLKMETSFAPSEMLQTFFLIGGLKYNQR